MSVKVTDNPPEPKIRENLGKFFYDLAKLSFAGIVVSSIVSIGKDSTTAELLICESIVGSVMTIGFAWVGFKFLRS